MPRNTPEIYEFDLSTKTNGSIDIHNGEDLAGILWQALENDDHEKVEQVLFGTLMKQIKRVVAELPLVGVVPLIRQLNGLTHYNRPKITAWIDATLRHHQVHLSQLPLEEREELMRPIMITADAAVKVLPEALKLKGRLEFVKASMLKRWKKELAEPSAQEEPEEEDVNLDDLLSIGAEHQDTSDY